MLNDIIHIIYTHVYIYIYIYIEILLIVAGGSAEDTPEKPGTSALGDSPVSPFDLFHQHAHETVQEGNPVHAPPAHSTRSHSLAGLVSAKESQQQTSTTMENTRITMEEATHMDALLSANLAAADTLPTMGSLMASLGETPSIHHANLCHALAMHATKDTPWSKLVELYPDLALAAIEKELASLEKHTLRRLKPGDAECDTALKEACPGRLIGNVRRPGEVKGRGAKQGFKENIATTDGPNFNYYSHVAKMDSVRSLILRGRRRCPKTGKVRRLATKDIHTHCFLTK
mgnify:CR=1 FL=1